MGKAKTRSFNKNRQKNEIFMTREVAVSKVVSEFKKNNFGSDVRNIISLFGLSAEELSEAGATYEDLKICFL